MKTTPVDNADLWILVLMSLRHSLGRNTHLCEYVPEMVVRYADGFSTDQIGRVADEIGDAIRCGRAGDECQAGLDRILMLLAERLIGETG